MELIDLIVQKLQGLPNLLIEISPGILLAFFIYLIGGAVVRRISKATVQASERVATIDSTLARFFGSLILFAGMSGVVIAALSAMNINLGFMATLVASMMIALGFALQDTLGDVASGVLLVILRPYKVGDEVEINGAKGIVKELGLFTTRMITRDNIELVVGNSNALGGTIRNYYGYKTRRLDMDFGVSYDADIGTAIEAITSAAAGDDRIKTIPHGPWAKTVALSHSSVTIQLRVWCNADQHRNIKMDMSARVKTALDAAGVEIPYEHNMIIPMKVSQNATG